MHCFDKIELLMGEIHSLLIELEHMDPDALLRMEQIMAAMRQRVVVGPVLN